MRDDSQPLEEQAVREPVADAGEVREETPPMADTPKHSVSVAGIVVDEDDRVLVIQRRDNAHWEPPGGILELGESPDSGTCREVFEETG